MKKIVISSFLMVMSFSAFAQDKSVVVVENEYDKKMNIAGLKLEKAGKEKNWSLVTGAASVLCFAQSARNTAKGKSGTFYSMMGIGFGLTSLTLTIDSNAKIAIAGKQLKK